MVRGAVRAAQGFTMGDPTSADTYLGPLALPTQPAYLQAQVDDAISKGAVLQCGGTREGSYVMCDIVLCEVSLLCV